MRTDWTILAAIAAICLCAVRIFNRLIESRNQLREGFSGIDVQLRRRADLIPNLVETVRTYAAHERGVIDDVTARRSSVIAAGDMTMKARADRSLQGSLDRLFAVAEAYPQLKADQNFLALQGQLAEIEDQLQMARRYYNGTVRDYNTAVESFPSNLVARAFGFTVEEFFQVESALERAVPEVRT
jgi:LemA protein